MLERGCSRGVKHLGVRIQRNWCYVADSIDRAELLNDGAGVKELRTEECGCRFGEGRRKDACNSASATRGWHEAMPMWQEIESFVWSHVWHVSLQEARRVSSHDGSSATSPLDGPLEV